MSGRPPYRFCAAALSAVALAGCASGAGSRASAPEIEVPARAVTTGDALLAHLPGGAEAVLELDLKRLRDNEAVGSLVRAVTRSDGIDPNFDVVRDSAQVVVCAYDIGDTPEQLVLFAGVATSPHPEAVEVASGVYVVGSKQLVGRALRVVSGEEESLVADRALMRLRALAMPEGAKGAALRAAARLGFDARVALARRLDLDAVPVSLSVWGDVADDLAVVALLGAEDKKDALQLGEAVDDLRKRVARNPALRRFLIAGVLRSAEVEVRGPAARVVLVIGPTRLSRLVEKVLRRLGEPT